MMNCWDCLKWLGMDASTSVITLLDDPADLVRLSGVSWSLCRFDESNENTLESGDLVDQRPSYWSSGGQYDPGVPESLTYSSRYFIKMYARVCSISKQWDGLHIGTECGRY
ncbi:hypothetical protein B296_00014530 [Ensete ventricosum]|uniref:Uncharacterized protein n=1 Tax=Ensete ventricosum TaxID=4639 RepID=A0A427ARD8_ENSVE|nr:hypothetical protein B296_00014530 [Ensete ventricosum]